MLWHESQCPRKSSGPVSQPGHALWNVALAACNTYQAEPNRTPCRPEFAPEPAEEPLAGTAVQNPKRRVNLNVRPSFKVLLIWPKLGEVKS
jgi:hypothetical protein